MKQKVELNNKTILVTGSPGFIGANLVLRLIKELDKATAYCSYAFIDQTPFIF